MEDIRVLIDNEKEWDMVQDRLFELGVEWLSMGKHKKKFEGHSVISVNGKHLSWCKKGCETCSYNNSLCRKEKLTTPEFFDKYGSQVSVKENTDTNRTGMKFDGGKDRWDLLPWEEIEEIVKVQTFAIATKGYKENSWKNVRPFWLRYSAAFFRHFLLRLKGEVFDKESGLRHTAHMATNVIFLLWGDKNLNKKDMFGD